MCRKGLLGMVLFLSLIGMAIAAGNKPALSGPSQRHTAGDTAKTMQGKEEPIKSDTKELSGISIVGNDEAPKSLYIVPWKGSEIGAGTSMGMELSNSAVPVDRDVFMRQLEFYKVSTKK
jgi:hypothetical protein